MNNRDYSLWLIPLLAVIAISYPLPSAKQSPTVVSSLSTTPQPIQSSGKGRATVSKYTAEGLIRAYTGQGNEGDIFLPPNSLEFLIATVPDPLDSSLAHIFDENLAAIERAMGAADYVLDRFELPWLEKNQEQGVLPVHQREPGIILFRRSTNDVVRLFVVFLVGETPTAGVHKDALKKALDQAVILCEQKIASDS